MNPATIKRAAARIEHDLAFGQEHGDAKVLMILAEWLQDNDALVSNRDLTHAHNIALAILGEDA